MYKEIVKKFLRRQPVNDADLNEFITTYMRNKKNMEISGQQLANIKQLIFQGIFNLDNAIKEAADGLNLQLVTITNSQGQLLRIDVYEKEETKEIEKGES